VRVHFVGLRGPSLTLCGRQVPSRYLTDYEDRVTCKSCHRVDDARTRRQYAQDCKDAGVEAGAL
jgi:hypothetical protein